MKDTLADLIPGIVLLGLGAATAYVVSQTVLQFNPLILAVMLGVVITNTVGVPDIFESGTGTHKLWLETGIVVMGARVALGRLFSIGPVLLLLVVGFLVVTLMYVEFLARNVYGLADRMGTLLAAGTSICGVSAIVAVAGSIKAKSDQIAYAAGTILVFDALTLAAYPVIGRLLDLPDIVFGTWAGISMFSTGPVVAAGFTYSQSAGQWATLTKLTRNVFIGFAAIAYALYYARRSGTESTDSIENKWRYVWDQFPKFVIGFAFVVVVASVGLLSPAETDAMKNIYEGLFLVAFVGLGLNINIREMRNTGIRPILTVTTAFVTISVLSLLVTLFLFG
jgi:uncharacterized integral membrane protein (TIGR00698 family)